MNCGHEWKTLWGPTILDEFASALIRIGQKAVNKWLWPYRATMLFCEKCDEKEVVLEQARDFDKPTFMYRPYIAAQSIGPDMGDWLEKSIVFFNKVPELLSRPEFLDKEYELHLEDNRVLVLRQFESGASMVHGFIYGTDLRSLKDKND